MTIDALKPIKDILRTNGVDSIAIIDDEFNAPQLSNYLEDDIGYFIEDIFKKDCIDKLNSLEIKVDHEKGLQREDFNDEVLKNLWDNRDKLDILNSHCEKYFFKQHRDKSEIYKSFVQVLKSVGVEAKQHGDSVDPESINEKIVLIDYYLGPVKIAGYDQTSKDHPSILRSQKMALDIFNNHEAEKPIIILISSLLEGSQEELISDFIKDSHIIGGLFHFFSKKDFDGIKFLLTLAAVVQSLPTGHQLHGLLSVFDRSIDSAKSSFLEKIRLLKLSDYAFIQKLSLQEDGHPLGDYLFQLYGAFFNSLLHGQENGIKTHIDNIDKLSFDKLPFHQTEPSFVLAEMYKYSIFSPLSFKDIESHPRVAEPDDKKPYLHLGDLFINDSTPYTVYMVINAQCDLAYAPNSINREFDENRSILMIPGKLESFEKLLEDGNSTKPKTELFEHKGVRYRIVWDVKHVIICAYDNFISFLKEKALEPIYRLKLPYALEIQHAFASDLTRVGMPVAPPLYRQVKARLCCNNSLEYISQSQVGEALIYLTPYGEYCSLRIDLIVSILKELVAYKKRDL